MAYKRGAITKQIPLEHWVLTITDRDGEEHTIPVTLTGKNSKAQAQKVCLQCMPIGATLVSVDYARTEYIWRQMTLAKFAALGDPVDPPVTINLNEEENK